MLKQGTLKHIRDYADNSDKLFQDNQKKIDTYDALVNNIKMDVETNMDNIIHDIEDSPFQQILMNYNF